METSPGSEDARLSALDRYDVLDTSPEEPFERIASIAQQVFQTPMATITFVDGHRQWLKAKRGMIFSESARCDAICDIAIRQESPLVIEDMTEDRRVSTSRFVLEAPNLRFYAGAQLRSRDGQNIGTLCVMDTKPRKFGSEQEEILRGLALIVMSELDLRLQATTDGLTGALSRRTFLDAAEQAKSLAMRHGHVLSAIMLDLDHFKSINDKYGHSVGDAALEQCADACRASLRLSDIFGRVGGEEFAAILPHTAVAGAMQVAERMRRAIAAASVPNSGSPVRISASVGVAELDRAAPYVDVLLARADEALYAAKNSGRNRCVEWSPNGSSQAHLMRKVLKAGQMAFNGGSSVIDCTVRGLCETGARLQVISTAGVPDRFKLKMTSEGTSRFCSVVEKNERELRVVFM